MARRKRGNILEKWEIALIKAMVVKGDWPLKKLGGGVLLYSNFRKRVWVKAFEKLAEHSLPYVTPHSARHCFISTLQSKGIEVGLVAKIAGHSDPSVTLGHYTQAVRDGQGALEALREAYVTA